MTMIIENVYDDNNDVYCAYMRDLFQEKMQGKFENCWTGGQGFLREVQQRTEPFPTFFLLGTLPWIVTRSNEDENTW